MLDRTGFTSNLIGLFYRDVDWENEEHLRWCGNAFKNLARHFVERSFGKEILQVVAFDDVKLHLMLQQFYRLAFGVCQFRQKLAAISLDEATTKTILEEIGKQSLQIESPNPRKTRIAAAFSFWMTIFRPIYLMKTPTTPVAGLWSLDAAANFYIATSYLNFFGEIVVGQPGRDRRVRLERIVNDFTYRQISLASIEMLYASIFRPFPAAQFPPLPPFP